jgi:2-polyprenyl-3-methyl-5-hydroxy-6-metoxy-1,4-benzoquinol methylase
MRRKQLDPCRFCGGALYPKPLLQYRNMPGAAQFFPDKNALAKERGVDLDVCQCSACGLVQLNGQPVPYYREVVRAAAFSPEMREFRLAQFREFADRHGLKGQKVVEIGCGRGEYLALLVEAQMLAQGLEFSAASVRACKADGLVAFKGFIDSSSQRLKEAPYAAFFILSFLEHLPTPAATLRGIANNLEDAAVGLVEVPNFDMIINKGLFSEFIGDHLLYFTKATLTQVLAAGGFDVIDCRPAWHDYILSATVRKKSPTDLSHFTDYQERIGREVIEFLGRFNPARVAIWGAGHQALALINLLELQHRVRYVVDSAPFKQGKFTPGSHLPIVGPERLVSEPVDAVLVMAASYSDEVARILREKYDTTMSVAILRDFGLEAV